LFTSQEVEAASCHFAEDAARGRNYWSVDVSGIRNADRQEVGPNCLVFFEKNGIPAFPNWSRPQKPLKNGLVSVGKSSEK
jgi:hypothetical protein